MRLKSIFRAIRPFMGDLDVKIDRARQIVTFRRNGQAETMNVEQLFDEIESIFSKARTAQTTLDPFGGGTIDRIEAPWLPNYPTPLTNPLGQALTEPGRPLTAPSA